MPFDEGHFNCRATLSWSLLARPYGDRTAASTDSRQTFALEVRDRGCRLARESTLTIKPLCAPEEAAWGDAHRGTVLIPTSACERTGRTFVS
jgi:hypothetical protein